MTATKLRVEMGALLDVPIYEPHKRGKNWLAVIELDPASPGGLKRRFFPRARGEYYYFIEPGTYAVEFGADYYSSSYKKHPNRVYGVLVWDGKSDTAEFHECPSAREAIMLAKQLNGKEVKE